MRLIDGDALPIVSRGKNHHRKYVFADITDAPTIDAIPVEWLEQLADYMRNSLFYDEHESKGIDEAVILWRQEQEAR